MHDHVDGPDTKFQTWDGIERRSGDDRRNNPERRGADRIFWERRSGQDRRGHPFYRHGKGNLE